MNPRGKEADRREPLPCAPCFICQEVHTAWRRKACCPQIDGLLPSFWVEKQISEEGWELGEV